MNVKRALRSATKFSGGDVIVGSLSKSQERNFEKKAAKEKVEGDIDSPSEGTQNHPAKRIKRITRKCLTDSILTEVVENNETLPALSSSDRLAYTHAPLRDPGGSGLVTSSKDVVEVSQTQQMINGPFSTTEDLLKRACDHLINVDARLKPLIDKYPCPIFSAQGLAEKIDPFESLCSGIMSQQISGAAATSVKKKFIGLFYAKPLDENPHHPKQFPSPVQVAACDISFLQAAGLSQRKAEYIKGLAEQFASGSLTNEILVNASDEEVLERLIAVRGLGKWSVEMFSCFGLKRMDVFSTGDLGVQYDFFPHICKSNF